MKKSKKILLVGGLQKTESIARVLIEEGHKVTIINKIKSDCYKLAEIDEAEVIYGDGSRPFVLEDASADEMDMVIALTKSDADNLVICELAKKRFGVKRTVTLLQDNAKIPFFKKMGIDSCVSEIEVITQLIEQNVVVEDLANSIPLDNKDVSILEVRIPVESRAAGRLINELHMSKAAVISCIMRDGETFIPRPNTQIHSGDKLIVSCYEKEKNAVTKELTGK